MTSKNPPKTAQLCEGVQTSPYPGFTCRRACSHFRVKSLLETSLIFYCIPFPTFTPKIRMFAGGRKEKFINGPHPPEYRGFPRNCHVVPKFVEKQSTCITIYAMDDCQWTTSYFNMSYLIFSSGVAWVGEQYVITFNT